MLQTFGCHDNLQFWASVLGRMTLNECLYEHEGTVSKRTLFVLRACVQIDGFNNRCQWLIWHLGGSFVSIVLNKLLITGLKGKLLFVLNHSTTTHTVCKYIYLNYSLFYFFFTTGPILCLWQEMCTNLWPLWFKVLSDNTVKLNHVHIIYIKKHFIIQTKIDFPPAHEYWSHD